MHFCLFWFFTTLNFTVLVQLFSSAEKEADRDGHIYTFRATTRGYYAIVVLKACWDDPKFLKKQQQMHG